MIDWYVYANIALVFLALQRFFYKVSAERRCTTAHTTFAFMGTVAVLSTALFLIRGERIIHPGALAGLSLVNSVAFLAGTMSTMEALKHLPTSIAYPLIRLNTVIVVIFGIVYFHDRLTIFQTAGIVLAVAVTMILTGHARNHPGEVTGSSRRGLWLVAMSCLSGSVAAVSSKFAAVHVNTLGFIALSYLMSTVFAFALGRRLHRDTRGPNRRDALLIGVVMGVSNFVGFYALLAALSVGPLSIIISISGMYFVLTIVLSAAIYRERLDPPRIAGIVLAVVSLILLRM